MTHRSFEDDGGRTWEVWDVYPARVRVWLDAERAREPAVETRRSGGVGLPESMRDGWLAFHCGSESRRLAPIPATWPVLSDADLVRMLESARTTPRSSP